MSKPVPVGLLGKVSDRKLAKEYNVTLRQVHELRKKRGIHAYSQIFPWTQAMLRKLGKIQDVALARTIGTSREVVRRKRLELGIRNPRRVVWTKRMLSEIRSLRPSDFARKYDVSPVIVSQMRRKLGLPAGKAGFQWVKEELALIGTLPDSELARRLRISGTAVGNKRKELHILPYKPMTSRSRDYRPCGTRCARDTANGNTAIGKGD